MRQRYGKMGLGLVAAAAVLAVLLVPWSGTTHSQATAAVVLNQAIEALSDLSAVHIRLNMRSTPYGSFDIIDVDQDLRPHDIWKQFGDPPKFRVEKAARVVVMDGESSLLLVGGLPETDHRPVANRVGPKTGLAEWLQYLMDVGQLLERELRQAEQMGWDVALTPAGPPPATRTSTSYLTGISSVTV